MLTSIYILAQSVRVFSAAPFSPSLPSSQSPSLSPVLSTCLQQQEHGQVHQHPSRRPRHRPLNLCPEPPCVRAPEQGRHPPPQAQCHHLQLQAGPGLPLLLRVLPLVDDLHRCDPEPQLHLLLRRSPCFRPEAQCCRFEQPVPLQHHHPFHLWSPGQGLPRRLRAHRRLLQ